MTDDDMDARLRAAGENWRSANTVVADHIDVDDVERVAVQPPPTRHRRHWLTALSAAVVAAALVIGAFFALRHDENGARSALPGAAQRLSDVTWTLAGTPIRVVFTDGAIRIFDGCTDGTYSLAVTANELTIGRPKGPISTCLGTPGTPGHASVTRLRVDKFDRIVTGTVSWSSTGSALTLTKAGVGTVVLTTDSRPAPALVGPTWELRRITDANGELPKVSNDATLVVTSDGKLQASDECNDLSGTVALSLTTLVVSDVAMTARGCADPILSRGARAIDQVLSGTVDYELRGSSLMLTKPGTNAGLVYTARPAPSAENPAQLTAQPWKLVDTEVTTTSANGGSASGSSAVSRSIVTFRPGGALTIEHRCYSEKGKAAISSGTAVVGGSRPSIAIPCASNAETAAGQRENDFVDALLTGTVTWKIADGTLKITKGGHSADFRPTR